MPRLPKSLLAPLLLTFPLATEALAQFPPKPGREAYEETLRYGFRIKVPDGWKFFPDERGNPNVLGRYLPERNGILNMGADGVMKPAMWILVFDADYQAKEVKSQRDAMKDAITSHYPTFKEWISGNRGELETDFPVKEIELVEEDEVNVKDTAGAKEVLYLGKESKSSEKSVHVWATLYDLTDRQQIAVVFSAPSDPKDWGKWRSGVKKVARSFARLELEELDLSGVDSGGVRGQRHRELLEMVDRNPGWELYVTPSYFVISNSEDGDFVEEIQVRLEAIREQFEKEFPPELAERAWEARKSKASKDVKAGDGEEDAAGAVGQDGEDGQEGAPRSAVPEASPIELSRCSVVRVCHNKSDYMNYGGPAGSAGYWWAAAEELVIYDDQEVGGRRSTWATLHHEAFHQFIFYLFGGGLNPGTWYNEGNADFYAGYELTRRKKYELGRFSWRNHTIQEEIRQKKNVPLNVLVEATRNQYYGDEPLGDASVEPFSRYPHGWSFVYFLRTGKQNRAKGWNDDWDDILDTYLNVLVDTQDVEAATEEAFAGVDWKELEEAWEEYILKGK